MDFIKEQDDILSYFGIEKQIKKFDEEAKELDEALQSGKVIHIREELADVHNVLMQLISYYGVREIHDIAVEKIERTKQRISEGYYD
jgi:NTP pyrophosphatase (non-canonical NTP hydrolase)